MRGVRSSKREIKKRTLSQLVPAGKGPHIDTRKD